MIRRHHFVLSAAAALFNFLPGVLAEDAQPDAAETQRIQQAIAALDSDDSDTRNAATKTLREFGEKAQSGLLAAKQKSPDAETTLRLTQLLGRIDLERERRVDQGQRAAEWREYLNTSGPVFGAGAVDSKGPLPADALGVAAAPGTETTDPLRSALDWLVRTQEADGHWDSIKYGAQHKADIEQTALALIVFLGHGNNRTVGPYHENVVRASDWLCAQVGADGQAGAAADGLVQAVVGLALTEAAGMSNHAPTKIVAQKVLDFTLAHQAAAPLAAGFYRRVSAPQADMLTTTFTVLYLKSAKIAQLKVPPAGRKALEFWDKLQDKAALRFRPAPGAPPSTLATVLGCVSRRFGGVPWSAIKPYADSVCKLYGEPGGDAGDPLTDYLTALLLFDYLEEASPYYWKPLRANLSARQIQKGPGMGSWTPAGHWAGAGRVFSTALNALSLGVMYRFGL